MPKAEKEGIDAKTEAKIDDFFARLDKAATTPRGRAVMILVGVPLGIILMRILSSIF
jgi:tetrahydromethanopterin S-methyltransferase subunit G